MNRNIVLFVDSLGSGGAQNQVIQIAKGLKNRGYTVFVIYYYRILFFGHILDENNIDHICYQKNKIGNIGVIRALISYLKKNNITCIISFLETPNFLASLAKLYLFRRKMRFIVSERSRTPLLPTFSLKYLIKKFYLKVSDEIFSNSYHERINLIEQFNINIQKIHVIYNIVDLERFKPKSNISKIPNRILCIGSISPWKNGVTVIKALHLYNIEADNLIQVDWYGQKVLHLKDRRNYLKKMISLIAKYNLNNYWNWFEPVADIDNLYNKYELLVVTSNTEGLPNVVCEALASGLPVIISDTLDHPLLVNKKRGFLFEVNNPQSLKDKFDKFYNLNALDKKKIKKNSRKFAENNFDPKTQINKIIKLCSN